LNDRPTALSAPHTDFPVCAANLLTGSLAASRRRTTWRRTGSGGAEVKRGCGAACAVASGGKTGGGAFVSGTRDGVIGATSGTAAGLTATAESSAGFCAARVIALG